MQEQQLLNDWADALQNLDSVTAQQVAKTGLDAMGPIAFGDRIILRALETLGEQWDAGRVSLAQIYMAGNISSQIVDEFLPKQKTDSQEVAVVVLDDFHTLGKSLVMTALRVSDIPVIDLGTQHPKELADVVAEKGIKQLLVSTLMLRSALRVEELKKRLDENDCTTRLVVGGAPFRMDRELWQKVGADASGSNAYSALSIVREGVATT